jgi:hypothetical protein
MRTTIDIDDRLLALAKRRALEMRTSLRKVIESALRRALMESGKAPARFRDEPFPSLFTAFSWSCRIVGALKTS